MKRPVRPVALVILTACLAYPGVTLLYQGLYPFVTGEYFVLAGRLGLWMDLAIKLHVPVIAVLRRGYFHQNVFPAVVGYCGAILALHQFGILEAQAQTLR